jgi:hypothetical protein
MWSPRGPPKTAWSSARRALLVEQGMSELGQGRAGGPGRGWLSSQRACAVVHARQDLAKWPALTGQPGSPPLDILTQFRLLLGGEVGTRFRNRLKLRQTDRGAELIDALRLEKRPGSNPAVARVVDPLSSESLRAILLHRYAIFEKGRVRRRYAVLGHALLNQKQRLTLEGRLAYGVLSDEPCRLRAIVAGYVPSGPPVLIDKLPQASGIPDVDSLHTRDIRTAELVRGREFRPDSHVLVTKSNEFAAQSFVVHETSVP